MYTLTLNDGTTLAGNIMPFVNNSIIFVYLTGLSIADGFRIFSDSSRISRITETIDEENVNVYEGYTEITAISNEFGNCNITLRRPSDAT